MEYRVIWCLDLDAEDEREAAMEAQRIMKDAESTATYFDVMKLDHESAGWLDSILEEASIQVELGG